MTEYSLGIGIRKHRNAMVADHAPVFIAHVGPYGEQSVNTLLAVLEHRLYHVGIALRVQHVEERMQGPVGVPKREHGVVGEAFGLVDVVVEAAILSVHVHVDGGIDHRVIQRSVEHRLLVFGSISLNDSEFLVPFGLRFGQKLVEITTISLGMKVAQGAFGAGGGECDFHLQTFWVFKSEISHDFAPRHLREVVFDVEFAPAAIVFGLLQLTIAIVGDGLVEADGKVGVVRSRPAVGDAITRQQGVVFHAEVGPEGLAVVVVDTVLQVKNDAAILAFWIGITVDASVFRCCQLGFDAVILQKDFVIAWRGNLRFVAETRAVARIGVGLCARMKLDFSRDGHHQNIAQVRVPRAAEVGVAEADDGAVSVLIASAILINARLILSINIVWHSVGVGAELHDAKRCTSPWECVPHAVRPDDGVDVLQIVDGAVVPDTGRWFFLAVDGNKA